MNKKKIVFLFPGQGAQYVGMMKDFHDTFPEARDLFEEANELLGQKLSSLIFEGPQNVLTLTKNSQLAIFVASLSILRVFEKQFPEVFPAFAAGLSLGEYTALVGAKKVTFADCLPIVAARGQFMNDACEKEKGGLSVVLGMLPEDVERELTLLRPSLKVWVANLNCPGQVVIAGDATSLEKVAIILKEKGAKRVLPLDVSGAFHSELMHSAKERLAPLLRQLPLKEGICPIIMNTSGGVVTENDKIREHLIAQVTSPVLWEKGIRSVMDGVDLFIEMGPGKTLQGMNKRIGIVAQTISIEKLQDLDEFNKVKDGLYASS
jgi:[acyl-carrier-protein] S-malonyltransferase